MVFVHEQSTHAIANGVEGHWESCCGSVVSAVRGYNTILPSDAGDYDVHVSPAMYKPLDLAFSASPVQAAVPEGSVLDVCSISIEYPRWCWVLINPPLPPFLSPVNHGASRLIGGPF